MGTFLNSIHIFGNTAPADHALPFRSFSPGWLTCVDDFSVRTTEYTYNAAKFISAQVDDPVLHFGVYDSEMLWFVFFLKGKVAARYSDDELVSNKKLFDIPTLIGYGEGQKKRLSTILSCSDTDFKTAMLEEYFGVCLLPFPELLDKPEMLLRERTDKLYLQYQAEEKALTGKAAPISFRLTAEYPGKLFYDVFGKSETFKPHFFLHGYTSDSSLTEYHDLTPVQFTENGLEASTPEAFAADRIPRLNNDPRFLMHYGTPCKVTFSEECPPGYCGKAMTLPRGYFPKEFLPSGELLLEGNHRIYIADHTLKIIAKQPIKGDIADVIGNHLLTTTGDSFCGYCYGPKAKIYIYEAVKKNSLKQNLKKRLTMPSATPSRWAMPVPLKKSKFPGRRKTPAFFLSFLMEVW